jgi:hypothetical protein
MNDKSSPFPRLRGIVAVPHSMPLGTESNGGYSRRSQQTGQVVLFGGGPVDAETVFIETASPCVAVGDEFTGWPFVQPAVLHDTLHPDGHRRHQTHIAKRWACRPADVPFLVLSRNLPPQNRG